MKYNRINIISIIFLISHKIRCSESLSNSTPQINIPEIPQVTTDGWQVSSLIEQDINSKMIGELSAWIEQGEFGKIHSLQIARHGNLVLDEYFRSDHNTEYVLPLALVTKSIASLLIVIPMDSKERYGFQWRLLPINGVENHTPQPNNIIFTSRLGGVKLYIISSLDLTVVFTDTCTNYKIDDNLIFFALELYIIPAAGENN